MAKNGEVIRRFLLLSAMTIALAGIAWGQNSFREGDPVVVPDGRTGKIDSFKPMSDLVKVRLDDGTSKFFVLSDLKKVEVQKPQNTNPPETLRVGDIVVTPGNPKRQLKIESISGDSAVVRYGVGRYNVFTEKLSGLMSVQAWERRQNIEKEAKLERAGFEDEAKPYTNTIRMIAPSFNPKIVRGSGTSFNPTPATYEAWRKDLTALASICQKYPNLTNEPFADEPTYESSISYRQADWCEMARQRDTLIKGFLKDVGSDQTKYSVNSVQNLLNEAERQPDGEIGDELQVLLFNRAAWSKKNLESYKTQFGLTDADIETKVFTPLAGKFSELKERIESDSLKPGAPLPKFSDPSLAATVKRTFTTAYPGGQVLKIGLDSANWSLRDGNRNIGSNSAGTQYYLRIKGAYRIRTGVAIVRLPNQPYCQSRYIELTQPKKGAGFDAAWAMVETKGKYVKCP